MRVINTPAELVAPRSGFLGYTLGNFDGVHQGHQAVIAELVRTSETRGGTSVAVTFDPHPLAVVRPESAPKLLAPLPEKLEALSHTSVDIAMVVDFTLETASEDAAAFLSWLGVSPGDHLVLGYDFQMGRERQCDLSALSAMGAELGFGLDVVPPVEFEGLPISSSRIRAAVADGDVEGSAAMLGRPYWLAGKVVSGRALGRRLGSPTANLELPPEKLLPGDGVYFATVRNLGSRPAVLYVGSRPTLEGTETVAEVHLLDFEGDLYGSELTVEVRRRLRGDERFGSLEELEGHIKQDIARARSMADGGTAV